MSERGGRRQTESLRDRELRADSYFSLQNPELFSFSFFEDFSERLSQRFDRLGTLSGNNSERALGPDPRVSVEDRRHIHKGLP